MRVQDITSAGAAVLFVLALLMCVIPLFSCNGNKTTAKSASSGLLSGNWQIVLQPADSSAASLTEYGFLLQSGNSVRGQLALTDPGSCSGLGSVTGEVAKANVAITINHIGQSVNLTGTVSGDGSSMSGTYSVLASGCSDGSSTGTWSATSIKQVTGSYVATFTSNTLGAFTFVTSLAQGPNSGMSVSTLSGTMTSSNAPCGNSLSVTGVIGGTSMAVNFAAPDGMAVGQFTGTTSADATSLSGQYEFVSQAVGCSGDAGTVAAKLQ